MSVNEKLEAKIDLVVGDSDEEIVKKKEKKKKSREEKQKDRKVILWFLLTMILISLVFWFKAKMDGKISVDSVIEEEDLEEDSGNDRDVWRGGSINYKL